MAVLQMQPSSQVASNHGGAPLLLVCMGRLLAANYMTMESSRWVWKPLRMRCWSLSSTSCSTEHARFLQVA